MCLLYYVYYRRPGFQESEKCSVLSVKGLDATKYNCDRLFRLLSMYASVTRVRLITFNISICKFRLIFSTKIFESKHPKFDPKAHIFE